MVASICRATYIPFTLCALFYVNRNGSIYHIWLLWMSNVLLCWNFFFNKPLQMSLFTCMASSNIFDVMEVTCTFHSQMTLTVVGIMNEICYCYAFIKSICLLMDPLQYLGVYLTFQLVSLCVFIVEYSFMSTLKWHLFMTSLKPV